MCLIFIDTDAFASVAVMSFIEQYKYGIQFGAGNATFNILEQKVASCSFPSCKMIDSIKSSIKAILHASLKIRKIKCEFLTF